MPNNGKSRLLLLILYFFSGACALVYEVLWGRMFGLVLGTTIVAWAIVLSAYMGGMALGSFFGGRLADRFSRPLRLFAFCEAGIGVFGACSWAIVLAAQQLLSSNLFINVPASLLEILRISCSGIVLMVPTILMGATFPLVSKGILSKNANAGRDIGIIYSVNTFGAVFGAMATGFVLLPALGMSTTLYLAALINIAVSAIILVFFKQGNQNQNGTKENAIEKPNAFVDAQLGIFPFVLACSGFCAMAFEVLWGRCLVFFLTSTTYAFTAMLSIVLAGLACGAILAALIARHGKNSGNSRAWISGFQLFIGFFACVAPLLLQNIDPFLHHIESHTAHTWFNWLIVRYAVCFGMVFPPALCLGATFPLSMGAALRSFDAAGKSIGLLLFVNTAAGIVGALAVTFILVPAVGVQSSFVIIALGNFSAGFVALGQKKIAPWKKSVPIAVILALLLVVSYTFANKSSMVSYSRVVRGAERPTVVVSYKEDRAASVAVLKTDCERVLNIDGFNAAGTYRYEYMHLMGHLPVLLAAHPDTALVICLGTGATCGAVGLHENVLWEDCAEISSAVISSVHLFADVNNNLEHNAKIHILHEDGRNHLLRTRRTYDVVTLEPMHPYLSSATNLYSADFYALCRKRLSAHGVMAQWAPLHVLSPREYRMLIRSFTSVFPHSSLWFLGTEGMLIGTMDSLHIDIDALKVKMAQKGVAEDLAKISLATPERLLSCFVMDESALASYVNDVPAMTDDHPIIEFTAPRNLALPAERMWLANMEDLMQRRVSVLPFINKQDDFLVRDIVRSSEASSLIMNAQIAIAKQDYFPALFFADSALTRMPNDTTAKLVRRDAADRVMASSLNTARLRRHQGNLLDAEKAYLQVLSVDSANVVVQTEITTLYVQMGLYEKGLRHAETAVAYSPNDPELLVNLAVVYLNVNRLKDAEAELGKAVGIQSDNKRARYYLAMLQEEKGKFK